MSDGDLTTVADVMEYLALVPTSVLSTSGQYTIPATPYKVTVLNATYFVADGKDTVLNYATSTAMTKVTGTPTTGQYNMLNGVYTFAAADTTKVVVITYNYSVSHLLQRLVTSASSFIQTHLNRDFAATEYSETRNGTGGVTMMFGDYPVTAVSSLKIHGQVIPEILDAGDMTEYGYLFDDTTLYLRGYSFVRGIQNVSITYTAGYAAIPTDIGQVTIDLVARKFKERSRIGLVSENIGQQTMLYAKTDLTDEFKSLLRQYQKVIPV